MLLLAVSNAITSGHLKILRVILFLLPSMAMHASILQVTPITIRPSLLLSGPKLALFLRRVLILVRFAPIVLPMNIK